MISLTENDTDNESFYQIQVSSEKKTMDLNLRKRN